MNVIRHDDPRLHSKVVAVGFEQSLLDELRHVPPPKPTFAVAAIQPRFELLAFRGIVRLTENSLPLGAARHRKGVVELKCNELRDTRCVEVRQVTTLMPAAKAFPQLLDGWFSIPFPLGTVEFG